MGACESARAVLRPSRQCAYEPGRNSQEQQLHLPSSGDAQKSKPVLLRGLFSLDDIEFVRHVSNELVSTGKIKPQSRRAWSTRYLHANGAFQKAAPGLVAKLMDAAMTADASEVGMGLLRDLRDIGRLKPRCIEHHQVSPGGHLSNPLHFDEGSLLTVDVMLSDPAMDFEGGQFRTLEDVGQFATHPFGKGDALVFVSHKYHCVSHVHWGFREVLVMEIWEGKERRCDHRCDQHWGVCDEEVEQN